MSILNKILGDANERKLKKLEVLVKEINQLEPQFERFSNEQLKERSEELKKRVQNSSEGSKARSLDHDLASQDRNSQYQTLDEILPEAFALVREAAKRTLGQPF
jgi:preprotein translocase subunit SecA